MLTPFKFKMIDCLTINNYNNIEADSNFRIVETEFTAMVESNVFEDVNHSPFSPKNLFNHAVVSSLKKTNHSNHPLVNGYVKTFLNTVEDDWLSPTVLRKAIYLYVLINTYSEKTDTAATTPFQLMRYMAFYLAKQKITEITVVYAFDVNNLKLVAHWIMGDPQATTFKNNLFQ